MEYFIKSGRLSKISGYIAGKLNLQGIGIENEGLIQLKQKVRGYRKSIQCLIDDMKDNEFTGKNLIYCLFSHMFDSCNCLAIFCEKRI